MSKNDKKTGAEQASNEYELAIESFTDSMYSSPYKELEKILKYEDTSAILSESNFEDPRWDGGSGILILYALEKNMITEENFEFLKNYDSEIIGLTERDQDILRAFAKCETFTGLQDLLQD